MIAFWKAAGRLRPGVVALGLGGALWAGPAAAQRAWSVEVDNDFFNAPPLGNPTDADYSQGLRIRHRLPGSSPLGRRLFGQVRPCRDGSGPGSGGPCQTWDVRLDQEVYTPWVDRPSPVPGDRRYAGWLGVALRSVLRSPHSTQSVTVKVGVTGPASLAAKVQRLFHQLIHNPLPLGWANQLPDGGGVEVDYEGTTSLVELGRDRGVRLGVEPSWTVALGSIRTGTTVGLRTVVEAGARGAARWRETGGPPRGASVYLVGGVSGRAVVHDLFLDSQLADVPAVGHLPFVAGVELGLGVRIHGVGLEYRMLRSTREYITQPYPHTYATIAIMR